MKDREKIAEEGLQLAEKALDNHSKAIQKHLAFCFMAGQLTRSMTAISLKKLPKNEKRNLMIKALDTICVFASKAFPDISEIIDKFQENSLKELKKVD